MSLLSKSLTPRELEVLVLVCKRNRSADIAEQLKLINNHRKTGSEKFGVVAVWRGGTGLRRTDWLKTILNNLTPKYYLQ